MSGYKMSLKGEQTHFLGNATDGVARDHASKKAAKFSKILAASFNWDRAIRTDLILMIYSKQMYSALCHLTTQARRQLRRRGWSAE